MVVPAINHAAAWAANVIAMTRGRIVAEGSSEEVVVDELLSDLHDTPSVVARHRGRPLLLRHYCSDGLSPCRQKMAQHGQNDVALAGVEGIGAEPLRPGIKLPERRLWHAQSGLPGDAEDGGAAGACLVAAWPVNPPFQSMESQRRRAMCDGSSRAAGARSRERPPAG